jgi:hypothetical protein
MTLYRLQKVFSWEMLVLTSSLHLYGCIELPDCQHCTFLLHAVFVLSSIIMPACSGETGNAASMKQHHVQLAQPCLGACMYTCSCTVVVLHHHHPRWTLTAWCSAAVLCLAVSVTTTRPTQALKGAALWKQGAAAPLCSVTSSRYAMSNQHKSVQLM